MTKTINRIASAASAVAGFVSRNLDIGDVFFWAGLGCLCRGAHGIYPPAAWIVGGVVLVGVSVYGVVSVSRKGNQ